ncbi:MAG: glycosyltransferase family 4 protein [Thiobacillus sp.]|nr:glycosyltransferase family 4 protein [Thiobacillus sp.]
MRILLLSQYFWPENFRINELAATLQAMGMQVTVLTGKPNYPEGNIYPGYKAWGVGHDYHNGSRLVRLPLIPRGGSSSWRLALNYLSFVLSGCALAPTAMRGQKFDLVFVYAPSPLLQALPAILLARLKRAPLVVWVQDLWPESLAATNHINNRLLLRGVEAIVRFIYRRADSILIQSEAFRAPVARLTNDPGKIRYYPNSAPPLAEPGHSGSESAAADEIGRTFSVVFAGNLGTAQALDAIVDAAERLHDKPGIKFFLVGSGSQAAWLDEETRRRRLHNLVLLGRLPETAMPAIFRAASVLLVTLKDSPAFQHTIPSKVQAYLAAGRPIIAALNGEGARLIEAANAGVACPAGDSAALANAVLKLQSLSSEERNRLGENGRAYFKRHFDPQKLASELIEHFQSVRRNHEERVA